MSIIGQEAISGIEDNFTRYFLEQVRYKRGREYLQIPECLEELVLIRDSRAACEPDEDNPDRDWYFGYVASEYHRVVVERETDLIHNAMVDRHREPKK